MRKFYIYSTLCKPVQELPHRGTGVKTYCNFSQELLPVEDVVNIPDYEEVVGTRVYENFFPEKMSPPYDTVAGVEKLYRNCKRCQLANYRIHVVSHSPTVGTPENCKIVLMGQCPGKNEDHSGFPFVGASGNILNLILKKSHFTDSHILLNTVGCIPNDGPDTVERLEPRHDECLACSSRLWLLLANIRPNIIVCLGSVAASLFWKNPKEMIRNEVYQLHDNLLVGYTWHPSYIKRKMNKGGMSDYELMIEFLAGLSAQANKLKPYPVSELWRIRPDGFPIQFVDGHFQSHNQRVTVK